MTATGSTKAKSVRHIYLNGLRDNYPRADPEVAEAFHSLVQVAAKYRELTGRHLSIFGELGELYAEVKFGIKRHRLHAAGSHGRLGNDFIEIKTIGPGNRSNKVRVKRSGNFSKVMVVRITDDYGFEARMVERKVLRKGLGKWITYHGAACRLPTRKNCRLRGLVTSWLVSEPWHGESRI